MIANSFIREDLYSYQVRTLIIQYEEDSNKFKTKGILIISNYNNIFKEVYFDIHYNHEIEEDFRHYDTLGGTTQYRSSFPFNDFKKYKKMKPPILEMYLSKDEVVREMAIELLLNEE